ncbi:DUF485 domain-containing protein [Chrysiogenes arsenatis]|uniref:DUF485 domain-containing protein n=1 Tax=Chrysiogenes arsenatis TaxID=309797 RepID=UPI0004036C06|nr:DUF485 domain-containing protein [Chrysiogenes arsenatis]
MDDKTVDMILNNPTFLDLVRRRRKLTVTLTFLMLAAYGLFLTGIAFFPDILAIPVPYLTYSVIPIGIPIAIGVICFAFVLTGIYVVSANRDFDTQTQIIKQATYDYQRLSHSGDEGSRP